MAVYKVEASGKAPTGLNVNDYVVTGGGTYQIKNVKPDGTYDSELIDKSVNTGNYANQYGSYATPTTSGNITTAQAVAQATSPATAATGQTKTASASGNSPINAGAGSTVSNYGDGTLTYDSTSGRIVRTMPNGQQYYVDPGAEKYNSIYAEYVARNGQPQTATAQSVTPAADTSNDAQSVTPAADTSNDAQIAQYQATIDELINQLANSNYSAVDQQTYKNDVMSYDEAYQLAKSIVEPQYVTTYKQAENAAAQNLDRAGLYNTLYGQALAERAQQQVAADMNAAIAQQALELQNMSREDALAWYQAAVDENQYGNTYKLQAVSSAADAAYSAINALLENKSINNNYALQAASLQLEQQAQAIDAAVAASQITAEQAETEYRKLQTEALKLSQASTGSSTLNASAASDSGSDYANDVFTVGSDPTAAPTAAQTANDYNSVTETLIKAKNAGESDNTLLAALAEAEVSGAITRAEAARLKTILGI